jgi:hypothetical protein
MLGVAQGTSVEVLSTSMASRALGDQRDDTDLQSGVIQTSNGEKTLKSSWIELLALHENASLRLRADDTMVVDGEFERFTDAPPVNLVSFIPLRV